MLTYKPYLFGITWALIALFLNIGLDPFLYVIAIVYTVLSSVYYGLVRLFLFWMNRGDFGEKIKNYYLTDVEVNPLFTNCFVTLCMTIGLLISSGMAEKDFLAYFTITAVSVNILFLYEFTHHISTWYLPIIKKLTRKS